MCFTIKIFRESKFFPTIASSFAKSVPLDSRRNLWTICIRKDYLSFWYMLTVVLHSTKMSRPYRHKLELYEMTMMMMMVMMIIIIIKCLVWN